MPYAKSFDLDVVVLVDDSVVQRMRVHTPTQFIRRFEAINSIANVGVVGLENMFTHVCYALGTIELQRLVATHDPGRQNQVGQPGRVIGVQVPSRTTRVVAESGSSLPAAVGAIEARTIRSRNLECMAAV